MGTRAEEAWRAACEGLPAVQASKWWALVKERYVSAGRCYHDLEYLDFKLHLLENAGACNPRALTFAVFFQYYEYDPREGDAAEKNIAHFQQFAKETAMDSGLIENVIALLSTESTSVDHPLLMDLDMSALGASPEQYQQMVLRVRKEYSFLSDDGYKALRRKVLQSFLQIPSIFTTDAFRSRFEAQARVNMKGEVISMSGGSAMSS